MLLHLRDGEVLLEKRPPAGVWGGLWCFPEIGPGESGSDGKKLPVLRHAFTHFTLDITPILRDLGSAPPRAAEPGQIWLPVEEAIAAAVPAPVRKLLVALDSGRLRGESLTFEKRCRIESRPRLSLARGASGGDRGTGRISASRYRPSSRRRSVRLGENRLPWSTTTISSRRARREFVRDHGARLGRDQPMSAESALERRCGARDRKRWPPRVLMFRMPCCCMSHSGSWRAPDPFRNRGSPDPPARRIRHPERRVALQAVARHVHVARSRRARAASRREIAPCSEEKSGCSRWLAVFQRSSPQRAIRSCLTPRWSRMRATTKSTRSSTRLGLW